MLPRGDGAPFGKGSSLSPHAPLSLPKTFALVPGRWRNATGGKKDGQSPGEHGGRWHAWPCSGIKSARSQRPGAFALAGWGTGQAVFPPLCTMASTWGSRGLRPKGQEEDCGTPSLPATKVQTRGARSGTDRAPLVWRSFIRRRGPACRSEEKVLEGRGKGWPGAARRAVPVTTKEVTGIESWLEGGPFPRKGFPPPQLSL